MDLRRVAPLVCALLLSTACAKKTEPGGLPAADENRIPVVYAMTYPLTYFVERIAGDLVDVSCPVPPEEDPHFWMAGRALIQKLQTADLIVMNGAQLERWEMRAFLPITKTIHAAAPLKDDYIVMEETVTHSHGPTGAHSHEGVDGYVWLDPLNAVAQAREVTKGLKRAFPRHEDTFDANLPTLVRDLKSIDTSLSAASASYDGTTILTSHPFYNYVGRRYGWKVQSLLLEAGQMPSDSEFVSLRTIARKTRARFLIWEADPTDEVAKRIERELGLKSVVFSPCATLDDSDRVSGVDFINVMKQNVENVRPVFASGD